MKFWPRLRPKWACLAYSPIEALVFASIGAVAIGGLSIVVARQFNTHGSNELTGEALDLRRFVEARVNCFQTVTAQFAECNAVGGSLVKGLDASGALVIIKPVPSPSIGPVTTIGADNQFEVTARCAPIGAGHGIFFKYRRVSVNGSEVKDPLNPEKSLGAWADLFDGMPMTCAVTPIATFTPTTTSTPTATATATLTLAPTSSPSPTLTPTPSGTPDVVGLCTSGPRLTKTFTLSFPKDTTVCNWKAGMGKTGSGYIAALEPIFRTFMLDEATSKGICSLTIATNTKSFKVDDEVIFTLGASNAATVNYLMYSDWFGKPVFEKVKSLKSGNVFLLELPKLIGFYWRVAPYSTRTPYCADGIDCDPKHRTDGPGGVNGPVYLSTTLNFMKNLPLNFLKSPGFRMGLWSDGDDDPGDCYSTAIDFIAKVEYVQ